MTHLELGIWQLTLLVCLKGSLVTSLLKTCQICTALQRTLLASGCCSIPAARWPTLALSILAVTTSSRSSALSMPVAANDSGSSFGTSCGSSFAADSVLSTGIAANPPPAAMAPGPAGLGLAFAAPFFVPALGEGFLTADDASSSARSRAFSALRARSALR